MPIKELKVNLDPETQSPEIVAKKRVLSKILQGNWNTLIKGEGIEFAGFREYTFEDDASQIDWKASLRSDRTVVRQYEEYRTLNVYVLLDVSDTMLFSSGEKLKAEIGAELAYSLCDSIEKTGDAVGFGMFTNQFLVNIPPNIGKGFVPRIRREMMDKDNYGGPSNIKEVLKYISATAWTPALIILISDFIGLEDGWQNYLTIIAEKMDILGIMIRDPRDTEFPSIGGQFVLQHPTTEQSMIIDTGKAKEGFKEAAREEERRVARAFSKTNSGFIKLRTDKDIYGPLLSFFYKRKQLVGD